MLFSFHVFVEVLVSATKICCGINFIFINSVRLRLNMFRKQLERKVKFLLCHD